MEPKDNVEEILISVLDAEKTSLKLKEIRENRNLKVSDVQEHFHFAYPQAIYLWENPDKKTLPALGNLVDLAGFYKVSLDELIVTRFIKEDMQITVHEPCMPYGISSSTIEFVKNHTSKDVLAALERYYGF